MSTILVADDNTNIQKMVSLAFEERGIRVVAVGNGEAAVRRMPDVRPDVVLADVFMPVRSGYEVCEFVKKDSRFAQTPVILLVGAFDPLDEKEARRVGADGVLKKPFVPPDPLIAMVTSLLNKAAKLAPAPQTDAPPAAQSETAAPLRGPTPVPEPEAMLRAEPDQFAVGPGPLSLREEDGSPSLEGLLGAAGAHSDTANPWDEPESEWQRRRAQMDYDIPGANAHEKSDSHADSPLAPAHDAEAQPPEDFVAEEPPPVSVEPGTLADLAANPAEWMEMMSAPLSAETSKAAPQWQSSTMSHEPAGMSNEEWTPAPTDASASEEHREWQEIPSAKQAPLEAPFPPQVSDLQSGSPAEATRATPPQTVSADTSVTPMWPTSFEAEYGISPETLRSPETPDWRAVPEAPNAGPSAETEHGEPAASAEPHDNAPVAQPQHAAGELAIESAPRPEYELLVAPAAAIPIRQTAEPSAATWQSGGPSAPRDLEEESTPEESSASSSYASYLPAAFSSDVIPTANESESEAAPADQPPQELTPTAPGPSSLDPAVVEALVAKVLERLRPELQEILSEKIVRPLVESALEHEISKK